MFTEKIYLNQTFDQLLIEESAISGIEFEHCCFKRCKFAGIAMTQVKFTDCDFESCDLSLVTLRGCKFSEVSFKNSNLAGINWTELHWPLVKLTSPLYFYSSNISHSSFYGLDLTNLIVEGCKAHEVDFRESKLNYASFVGTDLQNSLFMHTLLKQADFSQAINYNIDPNQNEITQAKFSFPDVIGLLNSFNIKIDSWPNDEDS